VGLGLISLTGVISTSARTTTQVDLILSANASKPGDTLMAGVRMMLPPGWHLYWRNPGGAGTPPEITWKLPPGITAGSIQWPVPESLNDNSVFSYVYNEDLTLLVPLKVASNAVPGPVKVQAHVTWQECAKICLTNEAEVNASLVIGAESRESLYFATLRTARLKYLPKNGVDLPLSVHWEAEGDKRRPMILEWQMESKTAGVDFFPYASTNYQVEGAVERLADEGGKIRIRKFVKNSGAAWPTRIDGVLAFRELEGAPIQGYEVTLPPAPVSTNKNASFTQ
jgi:thiol:disulfide interchange protein DsbD